MYRALFLAVLLGATAARAEAPRVVADIAPVHSLAAQVMDGVATPTLLLPQGADPHSFQMRPSQVRHLSGADLVIWVGRDMTPWLERALTGTGDAASLSLLTVKGTHLRKGDQSHDHDHGDDHNDDHDSTPQDGARVDPHAWLSPENAAIWLLAIADELAALDPENAQTYQKNAAQARANLIQMDHEIQQILAPLRTVGFVLYHDAYGYFTEHYQLNALGSVRESDAAPPSAARLRQITDLIAAGKVACAFAEVFQDEQVMATLVEGTPAKLGLLDPSGATLPPGVDQYDALLRGQTKAFLDCLSP